MLRGEEESVFSTTKKIIKPIVYPQLREIIPIYGFYITLMIEHTIVKESIVALYFFIRDSTRFVNPCIAAKCKLVQPVLVLLFT